MNLKKWFIIFGFQGISIGAASLVISLFAVYGLKGNVRSAATSTALFSLGNLAGAIIVSAIIDRLERFEKLITIFLVLSSYSLSGMFFVKSLQIYYLLSFALGLAVSFIGPALTLYVNRSLKDLAYRRAVNFLNTFNSFGVTLGMLAGSITLKILTRLPEPSKMRVIFLIASIFFVIAALFSQEKEKEKASITVKPSISSTKAIFYKIVSFRRDIFSTVNILKLPSPIKTFIFATFLVFFGVNIYLSVFSIYLKEILKMTSQAVFLLYALNNFATNIAFMLSNKLIRKELDTLFIRLVVIIRLIIIILVTAMNFTGLKGSSFTVIQIAFVIFGFSWPFFYMPITFEAGELVQMKERGKIFGLLNIAINTAVITASFLSGTIALKFGYNVTFLTGALFILSGGLIFYQITQKS